MSRIKTLSLITHRLCLQPRDPGLYGGDAVIGRRFGGGDGGGGVGDVAVNADLRRIKGTKVKRFVRDRIQRRKKRKVNR